VWWTRTRRACQSTVSAELRALGNLRLPLGRVEHVALDDGSGTDAQPTQIGIDSATH
jgi:hypothetical protein